MKLKLDDAGNVIVENGMPVYVDENGNDIVHDAPKLLFKVTSLTEEKDRHFEKANGLQAQLDVFKGIDPKAAKAALETVEKLDGKKMIEAGEFDKLKEQMKDISDSKLEEQRTIFDAKLIDMEKTTAIQQDTIEHLMVTNHFAQSPYFSGTKPKTVLSSDLATNIFKPFFKVEGEGADIKMVGYIGGEKIPSRKDVGQPADFNEAIETIIEQHPEKDRFLTSSAGGGPGSGSNFNVDEGAVVISADDANIPAKYRAAREKAEKAGVPVSIV